MACEQDARIKCKGRADARVIAALFFAWLIGRRSGGIGAIAAGIVRNRIRWIAANKRCWRRAAYPTHAARVSCLRTRPRAMPILVQPIQQTPLETVGRAKTQRR
jgi:hypothetical protein